MYKRQATLPTAESYTSVNTTWTIDADQDTGRYRHGTGGVLFHERTGTGRLVNGQIGYYVQLYDGTAPNGPPMLIPLLAQGGTDDAYPTVRPTDSTSLGVRYGFGIEPSIGDWGLYLQGDGSLPANTSVRVFEWIMR